MFEWTNVTETCSYIQAPAKIGIVETGDRKVVLIDSGNDKDAGRKIHRMLRDRGLTLTAIYNTHSHADHIGGNQFLQSQYDCRIFAPEEELSFVLHPHLEPSFLYGGYPIEELRGKFLVARESRVEALCDAVLPPMLSTFSLPGHTFGMAGFRTEDDIVFLADCLCSKQALDKYGVAYVYDVAAYIRTLEQVENMRARLFIPSHAEPTENIAPLTEYNRAKVFEFGERLTELCHEPLTFETILKEVFVLYDRVMNFEQRALVGSTTRSYLAWLKMCGAISCHIEKNILYWQKM